jgi:hypothetical protein
VVNLICNTAEHFNVIQKHGTIGKNTAIWSPKERVDLHFVVLHVAAPGMGATKINKRFLISAAHRPNDVV